MRLEIALYQLANAELAPTDFDSLSRSAYAELEAGGRSIGWSFASNLQRAEDDGTEPDRMTFLRVLADVITGEAPLDSLEKLG